MRSSGKAKGATPGPLPWTWLLPKGKAAGSLGVALGGGGARGLAHIGVLKVLEEAGVEVDFVTGTSMGGLVALAWGAGMPAAAMEELAKRTQVMRLFTLDKTGLALAGTEKVGALAVRIAGVPNMEDLPRRCAVIAVDINAGVRVTIASGPVEKAVCATIAMPGVLSPVADGERMLVDGGILEPIPVQAAYELGARRVLAVDVTPQRDRPLAPDAFRGMVPPQVASSLGFLRLFGRSRHVDLIVKSVEVQSREVLDMRLAAVPPTWLIRPEVGLVLTDQFHRVEECVAAGERAARAALPALLGSRTA
jgi:NTE family protein